MSAQRLHYLRWGSDGETVRADNVTALIMFEIGTLPQRQVHALLGGFTPIKQPKTAFLLSAPVNIQVLRFAHAEAEVVG